MKENKIYLTHLGMKKSTAHYRLDTIVLNYLAKLNHMNYCYRCMSEGKDINDALLTSNNFQIDHKVDWDGKVNAKQLFFDVWNLALSHSSCNSKYSRQRYAVESKGITITNNKKKPYRVRICIKGEWHFIMDTDCIEKAKEAYDKKCIEVFGERAITHKMLNDGTLYNVELLRKYPIREDRVLPQLGISSSHSRSSIRRCFIFHLAKLKCNGFLECHRCSKEIMYREEFSIEHIKDWRNSNSPYQLFFDTNNITFSHTVCNSRYAANKSSIKNNTGVKGVKRRFNSKGEARYPVYVYDPSKKKQIYIGTHLCLIKAAKDYDYWAVLLQGENATTNEELGILDRLQKDSN